MIRFLVRSVEVGEIPACSTGEKFIIHANRFRPQWGENCWHKSCGMVRHEPAGLILALWCVQMTSVPSNSAMIFPQLATLICPLSAYNRLSTLPCGRRTIVRQPSTGVVFLGTCPGFEDHDGAHLLPTPRSFRVAIQESGRPYKVHFDKIMMRADDFVHHFDNNVAFAAATTATWRWCKDFVVPHGLCPWAPGSVSTEGSLQIFLVDNVPTTDVKLQFVISEIAVRFVQSMDIERIDPNQAIFFIVFLHDTMMNFEAFYDWYTVLEDGWDKGDDVTLAPFHPNWTYGDSDDPIVMEKRSPYPLVSLVATRVIDQAGEAATLRIAATNEQILSQKTIDEWETIYNSAIGNQKTII
jgi:hypothetical protein